MWENGYFVIWAISIPFFKMPCSSPGENRVPPGMTSHHAGCSNTAYLEPKAGCIWKHVSERFAGLVPEICLQFQTGTVLGFGTWSQGRQLGVHLFCDVLYHRMAWAERDLKDHPVPTLWCTSLDIRLPRALASLPLNASWLWGIHGINFVSVLSSLCCSKFCKKLNRDDYFFSSTRYFSGLGMYAYKFELKCLTK